MKATARRHDSPPRGYERLSVAEQKALIGSVFADAGWEAPRVVAALADAEDVYVDAISQVMAPRWPSGVTAADEADTLSASLTTA